MLTITKGKSTDMQKEQQVQIIDDLFRYKEYAEAVRKLQSVTSYDKIRFKNGADVIYTLAMEKIVNEDGYFVNHEKIVSESMQAASFNVFRGMQNLFKDVDFKNKSQEVQKFFIAKAVELIKEGKYRDDILYTLNNDSHCSKR